jgi:hypothetical protein
MACYPNKVPSFFFAIRYAILATSHGHAFVLTYDVSRLNECNNKHASVLFSNCLFNPINSAASGQHGSPDYAKTTWAASKVFVTKGQTTAPTFSSNAPPFFVWECPPV